MWLEVVYKPTSLFSLRRSDATNPAAKTLVSPSPYSVKMALLNAAICFFSKELAIQRFDFIKNLVIQFNLPKYLCVNNCFIKIQKEPKEKKAGQAFQSTVAFREYVFFQDCIKVGFKINNEKDADFLKMLLVRINYFGKRGGFFQFVKFNIYNENLPHGYSYIFTQNALNDNKRKILLKMDDFPEDATFDNVNTYSKENAKRDSRIYCFNIEQLRANKNFTLYKKVE